MVWLTKAQEAISDFLLKNDIFRYVESDIDPKTGEDRILRVYDKGQKPDWANKKANQNEIKKP